MAKTHSLRTRVLLNGGLGNQLFEYFAGVLIAGGNASNVTLDCSRILFVHDGIGIRAFAHGANEQQLFLPSGGRIPALDARWIELHRRLSRTTAPKNRTYVSTVHDFLAFQQSSPSNAVCVEGDLVSAVIPKSARDAGLSLELSLKRPTEWFKQMARAASETNPVMVHVRRGDYRSHEQWGLLGRGYYRQALEQVPPSQDTSIWIFSDEPDSADALVDIPHQLGEKVLVKGPPESPAAEALVLMTLGRALIMANSTLSWWAGQMTDGLVLAPVPFYRSIADQGGLTSPTTLSASPNWRAVDAVWE